MNKILNIIALVCATMLSVGCANLNLNPLSAASSENWYSNPEEVRISLNDFYRSVFYTIENEYWTDRRTDDWSQRVQVYDIAKGDWSSDNATVKTVWSYTYKNISRANRILEALDKLQSQGTYNIVELNTLRGEARFFRAFAYSRLITLWGDVPFYLKSITPEEAFVMGRTAKATVLKQIYEDFDYAADVLDVENTSSGLTLVDKGCAYAFKARIALYQQDWETAAAAAKACIDLGQYSLYDGYGELFRDKNKNCEVIFAIPHSTDLEVNDEGTPTTQAIGSFISRTAGGTHNAQPSWELLSVYEMTNGKTIDEEGSGFNPHDPFANRDPRCCETFAAPETRIYDIIWNPSPAALKTMDFQAGKEVDNKDSKGGNDATNCAYNSCCLRKGAQDDWRSRLRNENPVILMRYADVLLMYSEATIELNKVDDYTLAYINDIRARAYGVKRSETSSYPAITTTDPKKLRTILRRERRVEFAWEGRRYFDLQRWHQFENAFGHNMFGFTRNKDQAKKYFSDGNWFWPAAPTFDKDGFPCLENLVDGTYIVTHGLREYKEKVYLWPIPSDDVLLVGEKILPQNPGY